jgi:hypothetical protein
MPDLTPKLHVSPIKFQLQPFHQNPSQRELCDDDLIIHVKKIKEQVSKNNFQGVICSTLAFIFYIFINLCKGECRWQYLFKLRLNF